MAKSCGKILWVFIGAYVFYFSIICFLKFGSFSYNDFDLAIHSQVLWNILHGSIFNSILGIDFLGNHMHLILFLISPIYKIFPHPFTLLFLQALALGLGAYPLYLIARRVLADKLALTVSVIYLIYPALGYTNLYEFHPTVFATLFLFFMLYFYCSEKFILFLVFMALSLLCQENIPIVVIIFGVFALLKRKNYKWWLSPILIGGLYLWVVAGKLIPYFNKNTIQFIAIYSHLGDSYQKIIANIITHPLQVANLIFTKQKIIYLTQLFGPLSFIPLLSPLFLLPAMGLIMQHLLSLRSTEVTIYYHYAAELIPFIFFSFVFGTRNLLNLKFFRKKENVLAVILLSVSLGYNIYLGPHFAVIKHFKSYLKKDALDIHKEAFLRKIPENAPVVATFEFLPRLSHRKELYSFHHVYMGFHTLSDRPYELPKNVEYALLDFNDTLTFRDFYRPDRYENIRKFLMQADWPAVEVKDTIVLFQKDKKGGYFLYDIIDSEPKPENKVSLIVDNDIELLGYDLKEKNEGILHIIFYWHSLAKTQKDINVFFDIIDNNGKAVRRFFRPICYRIFPTQAWQLGQYIEEENYIVLPSGLGGGRYLLKMGFFVYGTGQLCKANTQDALGRINITAFEN